MIRKPSDNHAVDVNIISKTKKTCMSHSKLKVVLMVFFDIQGIVMAE